MNIYCFSYDFSVALISALALFEIRQFKTNCSGKKIDWDLTMGCSYLRNEPKHMFTLCKVSIRRHYILLFYTRFVDSACKQLTMASSQARNLLRPSNLSCDLTDDFVNNCISFFA